MEVLSRHEAWYGIYKAARQDLVVHIYGIILGAHVDFEALHTSQRDSLCHTSSSTALGLCDLMGK